MEEEEEEEGVVLQRLLVREEEDAAYGTVVVAVVKPEVDLGSALGLGSGVDGRMGDIGRAHLSALIFLFKQRVHLGALMGCFFIPLIALLIFMQTGKASVLILILAYAIVATSRMEQQA